VAPWAPLLKFLVRNRRRSRCLWNGTPQKSLAASLLTVQVGKAWVLLEQQELLQKAQRRQQMNLVESEMQVALVLVALVVQCWPLEAEEQVVMAFLARWES